VQIIEHSLVGEQFLGETVVVWPGHGSPLSGQAHIGFYPPDGDCCWWLAADFHGLAELADALNMSMRPGR
jgi:hypothetical protein